MATGFLALVLHAHLPYVRHPEYPEFLEEDWLFEAITETYIPLLKMMRGLVGEGVPFRLTMSLTPPLCAMLRDPLLQERYVRYIDRAIALAESEVGRYRPAADNNAQGGSQPNEQLLGLAQFYLERFRECRRFFVDECACQLLPAFARLQEEGHIEIITCAATHGFLPLMENYPEAVRAQILIARDDYRETFGRDPQGIWLPECGYVAGLENVLAEANLRWFILDSHGLMFGTPRPRYAIFAPCYTPAGPAAFARDRESSRQVWSQEDGYPGDPAYRDFYRDIGFDRDDEAKKFTGIKYHRITGRGVPGSQKELYNRGWAHAAADAHAGDFLQSRVRQLGEALAHIDIDPILVSPYDAELFGHWWFEGPEFLELFLRKAAYDQQTFRLTTPGAYLAAHPTAQLLAPSASSWGHKGYWEVWLDESNSWIYPHLHAAARRMTELATELAHEFDEAEKAGKTSDPLLERALRQLARELLLAQSSDWAFLMKTGTAQAYATKRTRDHILRFTRLYDQIRGRNIDKNFLENCEERDKIFQNLHWRYYVHPKA